MLFFVSLVAAIIGSYTAVNLNKAKQISSEQTGVAEAFMDWHATAISQAMYNVRKADIPALNSADGACSLTWRPLTAMNSSFKSCDLINPSGSSNGRGIWTRAQNQANECSPPNPFLPKQPPCFTALPLGYAVDVAQRPLYSFYSAVFSDPTKQHYYVLTFVPPPPTAADHYNMRFLCLPGAAGVHQPASCASNTANIVAAVSMDDFYRMLGKSTRLDKTSYGRVTDHGVFSYNRVALPGGVVWDAVIPQTMIGGNLYIPVGSIGVLSEIIPCSSTVCP